MNDPNTIYKTKFRELTELLGRVPTTTDSGWLALQEEYKRGWAPAEETVIAPRASHDSAAGPLETGFSRQPAPQARAIDARVGAHAYVTQGVGQWRTCAVCGQGANASIHREGTGASLPLSGPGVNQNGGGGASEPEGGSGPGRDYQRAIRGPGGGVLAVCEGCGREWERERRRGRPARLCGECR